MSKAETRATWELLRDLGFQPDAEVISDIRPGLSFDFGNFKLSASAVVDRWLNPVVMFTGVLATPRHVAEVCFELPREVASRELLAAFLAYYLDKAARGPAFQPARETGWLLEGRQNKNLLPWEIERTLRERQVAEYAARPHCSVDRDWLRLALKKLRAILVNADPADPVVISFDGRLLSIACGKDHVNVAAQGNEWTDFVTIPSGNLRQLPKRLMSGTVDVSVWQSELRIDGHSYKPVLSSSPNPVPDATP